MAESSAFENQLVALYRDVDAPPKPEWNVLGAKRILPPTIPRRHRRRVVVLVLAAFLAIATAVTGSLSGNSPPAFAAYRVDVLADGGALTCKLPVRSLSNDGTVGFVDFDNGKASFESVRTNGVTYLSALHQWVTAFPQYVSPDGTEYLDGTKIVGAHGTRRILTIPLDPSGQPQYAPLGWSKAGIVFLDIADVSSDRGLDAPDVVVANPATGAMRKLHPNYHNLPGRTAGEWILLPRSNILYLESQTSLTSNITAFDLSTGVTTDYFDSTMDGEGVAYVAAETPDGKPIVQVASTDLQHSDRSQRTGIEQTTFLMPAPHRRIVLNQGKVGDTGVADDFGSLPAVNGHSVWLATDSGQIWRYEQSTGLRQMASITASTQGTPGVVIAGGCQ
jgi:hypothetical protein